MRQSDVEVLRTLGFRKPALVERRAMDGLFRALDAAGEPIHIAVERVPLSGIRLLESAFARGWMRLRAAGHVDAQGSPTIVIVSRWYSSRTANRFREFIARSQVGLNVRWIVTDGAIARDSSEGAPEAVMRPPAASIVAPRPARAIPSSGFSDHALVCAKTILLGALPPRFRPRDVAPEHLSRSIRSVRDLVQATGISSAQAYRFVAASRRLGFLFDDERGFGLRDRRRLFSAFAERSVAHRDVAVLARVKFARNDEWPGPPGQLPIRVRDPALECRPGFRFAVTGHHALMEIDRSTRLRGAGSVNEGFGHQVLGAPLTIYVEGNFAEMAALLDLELAPDRSSWWNALLVRPRFPESVWRFVDGLGDPKRLPHVDIVQCVIDLLLDPFKGNEAVEDLARRVPDLFDSIHERLR